MSLFISSTDRKFTNRLINWLLDEEVEKGSTVISVQEFSYADAIEIIKKLDDGSDSEFNSGIKAAITALEQTRTNKLISDMKGILDDDTDLLDVDILDEDDF